LIATRSLGRSGLRRVLAPGICLVFVLGCAPRVRAPDPEPRGDHLQRELTDRAVERMRALRARLMRVARPIRTRNHSLCGAAVAPYFGLAVGRLGKGNLSLYEEAWKRTGLLPGVPTVIVVVEGSPAARAGIEPSDVLLAINGRKVRGYEDVVRLGAMGGSGRPRVRLRSGELEREVTLDRVSACAFEVLPSLSDELSTWTIGRRNLVIPAGLVELLEDDDELAIMISHELAHRLLDSKQKRDFEHELEADQLGLALAARAGFDVSGALDLWLRLALERPAAIGREWYDGRKIRSRLPHGRIAERLLVMPEAIAKARALDARDGESRP
jgi:hypothetical protein